jgi:hypothetical protein
MFPHSNWIKGLTSQWGVDYKQKDLIREIIEFREVVEKSKFEDES